MYDLLERPVNHFSSTEPLKSLTVKLTSSYNKMKVAEVKDTTGDGTVKIGTKCRNSGCDAVS